MLQSEIFLHQAATSWNTTLRENDFVITQSKSKRKNPEKKLFVSQSNFCRRAVSFVVAFNTVQKNRRELT
jgi:hypothetical protein